MLFSFAGGGIRNQFVDVSHPAIQAPGIPVSLGFRSQALKLRFATPKVEGRFLKSDIPLDHVMDVFEKRFNQSLPQPILHQTHVGDAVSLIYAPYYMKDGRMIDAVLDQPDPSQPPESWDPASLPGGRLQKGIDFLPTLCPNCGWDLKGESDSLVLNCKNCNTLWKGTRKGLEQLKFAHMPPSGDGDYYIPFWRIRAETIGVSLASYGDLVRVANLPKAPRPEWEDMDFRFWVPAFKVRPEIFLRTSTHMTLAQPSQKLSAELPSGRIHPVNLPVKEAIESLKITLSGFMKPKLRVIRNLPDIEVRAMGYSLIYLPFEEGHHDLTYPDYQISIRKNHLKLAGNL